MQKLKQWFIPHKKNHFHPHVLRPVALLALVALLLSVNTVYNFVMARSFQVLGYATSISAGEVIALSNQQRAANGLPALNTSAQLNQAAAAKAQHMFANNYWAHFAPDGTSPWYFVSATGYSYTTAGENLAKDFNTSAGVVNGWMASEGHKANILNTSFQDTGVAVVNGTLLGAETTLVVAMYAAPKASAPAPAPTPAPAAPVATQPTPTPAPTPTVASSPAPTASASQKAAAAQPAPEEPQPIAEVTPDEQQAPTPAPMPADQPVQTPPEVATETPQNEPVPSVLSSQALTVREPMNWAQRVAIFLLSIVLLVNVLKHTIVWRAERRGWRHIWLRSHPAAQYGLILAAIIANVVSSVGVIQ